MMTRVVVDELECYFQIKKPNGPPTHCPFCNAKNYTVVYKGPKTEAERASEALVRGILEN
jgi:hypothetical protein